MRLSFHTDAPSMYSQGYWHAITDDGGYDASGTTPLDAVADLVNTLEKELRERDADD